MRTLLTVSGTIDPTRDEAIAEGRRPRADYDEIAAAADAEVIDHSAAEQMLGRLGRILRRVTSSDVVLAVACFKLRKRYATVLTDSERVGIPYAAVSMLARRRPRHVMIAHRLSAPKKLILHRVLGLRRRIDHVVVYSTAQRQVALSRLGYHPDAVTTTSFMVDTAFWRKDGLKRADRSRPLICAVGQELRDYPTLAAAVGPLDVDVVIAAASPWSRRADSAAGIDVPANVSVGAYDLFDLRQLYADSAFVVVPVEETDFQAGITTVLEAMSMGLAVICTRTTGQTDTVVDQVNGLYVAPGDVGGLRAAIARLLERPELAARLGTAGQAWARQNADVEVYAERLAAIAGGTSTQPNAPTRRSRFGSTRSGRSIRR